MTGRSHDTRHTGPTPTALPWVVVAMAMLVLGCARASRRPATAPANVPISNTDPCAMRLHDLCGPLLLYYANHNQLPPTLQVLRDVPGMGQSLQLTCPVSNRPYIYNRVGILQPEQQTRIIIYDPEPSHSGMRWGIAINEPQLGQPLVAKVIALPESMFTFQPK